MITFLGIVCIPGALWFGMLASIEGKGLKTMDIALLVVRSVGMAMASIACLYGAYICFGGTP